MRMDLLQPGLSSELLLQEESRAVGPSSLLEINGEMVNWESCRRDDCFGLCCMSLDEKRKVGFW